MTAASGSGLGSLPAIPLDSALRFVVLPLFVISQPALPSVPDRFALLIRLLREAIWARAAKNEAARPILLLIWSRLGRMAGRFAALAERVRTGPLRPQRQRTARPPPEERKQERQRWPGKFAWLLRLVPEAASYGSQLHHLLAGPEMAALLKTAPQAGRILRPLCRLLAQKPIPSLLPPPPKTARAAPPRSTNPPAAGPPAAAPPGAEPKPEVVRRRWRGMRMPETVP
jgi:hypothetical protein